MKKISKKEWLNTGRVAGWSNTSNDMAKKIIAKSTKDYPSDPFIVAVDFDSTIVKHDSPKVGPPVPGAIEWLRKFNQLGIKIILFTMRSDKGDCTLQDALDFLDENEIELYGINKNPDQKSWTTSPKPFANCYVDDLGFGIPLMKDDSNERPYVDWEVVGPAIVEMYSVYQSVKGKKK